MRILMRRASDVCLYSRKSNAYCLLSLSSSREKLASATASSVGLSTSSPSLTGQPRAFSGLRRDQLHDSGPDLLERQPVVDAAGGVGRLGHAGVRGPARVLDDRGPPHPLDGPGAAAR